MAKCLTCLILLWTPPNYLLTMTKFSPLGIFLLLPLGAIAQDIKLVQQRAASGETQAIYELGIHYRQGTLVAKDTVASLRWLWDAASKAGRAVQYRLPLCPWGLGRPIIYRRGKVGDEGRLARYAYAANVLTTMYSQGMGLLNRIQMRRNTTNPLQW